MIMSLVLDDIEDDGLIKWLNYQGKHYPGIRNRSAFIRYVLYEKMNGNGVKVEKSYEKVEKTIEIEDNLLSCIEGLGG